MPMLTRLSLIAACILLSAGMAAAQGVCTIENVQGTYVNVVSIYVGSVPMASIGLTKIDATGHWSGPVTIVTPFGVMPLASEGEIEVGPDCTAVITQKAGGYDHEWAAVILRNGEEIRSLHTDPEPEPAPVGPTVRTQTLVRLSAGPRDVANCSERDLVGRYAKTCTGWIRTGPGAYLPNASISTLTLAADGTGTGAGIQVFNGEKIPFTYEDLAVSVEPGCGGLATYATDGQSLSERLVVFDNGKQLSSVTLSPDHVDICRSVRMNK